MQFQAKQITVDAVQVTETTQIQLFEGTLIVRPGSWIVTMPDGEQRPYRQSVFDQLFGSSNHIPIEVEKAAPEPVKRDKTPIEPVFAQPPISSKPIVRRAAKKPAKKRASRKKN